MERRNFIKGAASLSAVTIISPDVVFSTEKKPPIRLGFIGCGGRGMADISSMSKNCNVHIVAIADLFEDQIEAAKPKLDQLNAAKGFSVIPKSNIYQGSEAYLNLLKNKEIDAVLISSPCYTHPEFLEAAVAAGKHIYCEKPIAIDVEGCRRAQQLAERINGKVSVAIGFQVPHATAYAEMINRIHKGEIGKIVNAQIYYMASEIPLKPYKGLSYDEARLRNQFHFRELSGGTLVDQGIHMIDICNRTLQSHPLSAIGNGGLNQGVEFGNAWNHYQVIFKYPNDINVTYHSVQVGKEFGDVCARFIGTKGIAEAHYSGGVFISGANTWDSGVVRDAVQLSAAQIASGVLLSSLHDADTNRHKSFINSIETGNYLNEIKSASESTLTAILGRNAAEAEAELSWDRLNFSNERIDPGLNLSQFNKI